MRNSCLYRISKLTTGTSFEPLNLRPRHFAKKLETSLHHIVQKNIFWKL